LNTSIIEKLPLWAVGLFTLALVLVSIRIGQTAGLARARRSSGEADGPVGSIVAAVLGLLAFMLAFTFGISSSRFDARKQLLLDEVNAIGTLARRADLLPEPHRGVSLELIRRYVDRRATLHKPEDLPAAIAEAESIQDRLFSEARAAMGRMDGDTFSAHIESLTRVYEVHNSRATVALQYRIPVMIWLGLFLVTGIAMAGVGYQMGLSGSKSLFIRLCLAVAFSWVVLLIATLDRPTAGMISVSQQPMLELKKKLERHP
jgi:hypothetical protein